jgi:hypothetical protein
MCLAAEHAQRLLRSIMHRMARLPLCHPLLCAQPALQVLRTPNTQVSRRGLDRPWPQRRVS